VRRSALLLALGLALAAAIGFAGLNPHLPGGGDNAEYIAQAEALVQSGHRANLHLAGDPQETFRPPLYPYLLSGLMRLCGRNVAAFKAANVAFALGAILAAWWFLAAALGMRDPRAMPSGQDARGLGRATAVAPPVGPEASGEAAWLALWFALTPLTLYCAHDVLTDVPFALLTLLALGCAARWERPHGPRWLVASVALLLLAMTLRTAALFVAGALAVYFLLELVLRRGGEGGRRRWIAAAVFPLLTVALLIGSMSGSQTYTGDARLSGRLTDLALRIGYQGLRYGILLAGEAVSHDTLFPYFPLPPLTMRACHALKLSAHAPGLLLIGATSVWGAVALWRRGVRLVPVVWLSYMGALLLWPFVDARFHLPVLPLFLAMTGAGARAIVEKASRQPPPALLGTLFAVLLLPTVCLIGAVLALGDPLPSFMTGFDWAVGGTMLAGLLIWIVARSAPPSLPRRLAALPVILVLGLALLRTTDLNLVREHRWGPTPAEPGWPEFHEAALAVRERAAPDDVVVSAKTSLVWFWTGLKGLPVPETSDLAEGQKRIARAQWAIVDDLFEERVGQQFLYPLLASDEKRWELVRQIPTLDADGQPMGQTLVYRRRDGHGTSGPSP